MASCGEEFPNEPQHPVTVDAIAWPQELHVADVDTLEIQVGLANTGTTVSGLRVTWRSGDDALLTVAPLPLLADADREDSLVAQRRAVVTARAGGWARVEVVIQGEGSLQPREFSDSIQVTQNWRNVSAGLGHSCGVTIDSTAYCWGEGDSGRLGTGRPTDELVPRRVFDLGDFKFIQISAGTQATCGVIAEHAAYCWGSGRQGRLGNGDHSEMAQVVPDLVAGSTFQSLSADHVTCGVGDDFFVRCWGPNGGLQLGVQPGVLLDTCLDNTSCSLTPVRVKASTATALTWASVAVGGLQACGIALTPRPTLAFCWGSSSAGALGNADTTVSGVPVAVALGIHFLSLTAGREHTCGLSTDSLLYCWGANAEGQLGTGDTIHSLIPRLITGLRFRSVNAGGDHTCGITTTGSALCWGQGSSGQLGNNSVNSRTTPFPVSGDFTFETIDAGDSHTCGIVPSGTLYCWGRGASGRLGTGSSTDQSVPTRVLEPR